MHLCINRRYLITLYQLYKLHRMDGYDDILKGVSCLVAVWFIRGPVELCTLYLLYTDIYCLTLHTLWIGIIFLVCCSHAQSDNYIMRLRLQTKTGTKDLSAICILFKIHPFCIDTASDTIQQRLERHGLGESSSIGLPEHSNKNFQ